MSYIIAGRAIKTEYLAIGTLLGTAAITALSMSGGKKKEVAPSGASSASSVGVAKTQGKVGSSEEEQFIRNFMEEAEKAEKH